MRTVCVVLLLLTAALPMAAQEEQETLISGEIQSGGFGGPVVKVGEVNGETGVFVGGRGGWIINHVFVLGGGGYGLATNVKARTADSLLGNRLMLGYGGLELEYLASSHKLMHLSFSLLVGGGGVGYQETSSRMNADANDAFFILEPGVHGNLNVTPFFRIAAGVTYRYVAGLSSALSTNADLSGPTACLTLKFGKF